MAFFDFNENLLTLADKALAKCAEQFVKIDAVTEYNQQKVLRAFIDNRVSEADFGATTGYGYGDRGRDNADRVCAQVFGAEDALIRTSFASGTHTLATMLFGVLRPGDIMLSVTGTPYDTIRPVIGLKGPDGQGSLKDFGVTYKEVALLDDGTVDFDGIAKAVAEYKPKCVYIQRSRGYTLRASLGVDEIDRIAVLTKEISPETLVLVDNCYGEFVEKDEPVARHADLMGGSLIKNPGAGIARCGGYICGRADLVELVSYRMTTPGTGREIGASLGTNRELFMGLFSAPHVTGEALKTAVFTAALFEEMGYTASPSSKEDRHDIIQSLCLENPEKLCAFCRGLQSGSPVDSFVTPEPWDMPGYDNQVIMAAGAFTNGSSIELSADAPLREPYAVWLQGGLNFHSAKLGVMLGAREVMKQES